jgi:hypothetical protein
LDDVSQRALAVLESSGLSRSEAIRYGLSVAADHLRRNDVIRSEAAVVAADQSDRQEMIDIAASMSRFRVEE